MKKLPLSWRYTNKPATKWSDIDPAVRQSIANVAHIHNEQEWLDNEQLPCPFCKDRPDHWISRCLKIWCASDAGRKFFGIDKAALRAREMQQLYMQTFEDVLAFYASHDADDENAFAFGELTHESPTMQYVCAMCEEDRYFPTEEESEWMLAEFDRARDYLYKVRAEVEIDRVLLLNTAAKEA